MLTALLCATLLCGAPQDTARVTSSLSASRINVGGTTTWRITVETTGAAPDEIRVGRLPDDLEVLGTSDFSHTQLAFPGGRTRSTRREIVLVARAAGVYRIPPAVVRIGSRTFRTDALDLVVTAGGFESDDLPSPTSALRVTLRPDTVYVGQQVLLFAEATFAEDMRARQSRPATFDPPAPTGFWIQDLPDPVSVSLRVREGRTVETQTYRRAYFPLSPGEFRFPPARLYYEVRRGFLYAPETRELASDSVPIVVRPLPAEGRPAGFNGAVGRLSMRASVSPQRVPVGSAATLIIELQGSGNVKALPEPALPRIGGAEVFSPTQDSRVEIVDDVVGGVKRFRWMIVPEEQGSLTIPPLEYSVFDPELRQYVLLQSDTLSLDVVPWVASTAADSALRPLRNAPGDGAFDWTRSRSFAAAQALPLLMLAAAGWVRRRRSAPPRPRDEAREIELRIEALRTVPPDASFLAELEHIVCDAVKNIARVDGDASSGLRAQKRPAAAAEFESLIAEVRRLRYAPAEPFDARRLIARAESFVRMIRPRRGWRGNSALLIAGVMMTATPLVADNDAVPTFHRGVVLYERGDFVGAAREFREYARMRPADPNGWYDLGLAAHRAGDPGHATWAWLRALELSPRDPDIRHNLRAIDATAALERVQPFDWLSDAERALLGAALWWVTALALSLLILFGHSVRAAAWVGGALLLLFLVAAVADHVRPRYVTPLGRGTSLYAAPTTRDVSLGELRAGEVARMLELREGWVRVRSPDGREAWLERGAVATP